MLRLGIEVSQIILRRPKGFAFVIVEVGKVGKFKHLAL
jgi:hypothetical protein